MSIIKPFFRKTPGSIPLGLRTNSVIVAVPDRYLDNYLYAVKLAVVFSPTDMDIANAGSLKERQLYVNCGGLEEFGGDRYATGNMLVYPRWSFANEPIKVIETIAKQVKIVLTLGTAVVTTTVAPDFYLHLLFGTTPDELANELSRYQIAYFAY